MKPLLSEAYLLLHHFAQLKGETFDRNVISASIDKQNESHALDVSAFNKLVIELAENKDKLHYREFEQKIFMISVYAMKISSGFDAFTKEVDEVMASSSGR